MGMRKKNFLRKTRLEQQRTLYDNNNLSLEKLRTIYF